MRSLALGPLATVNDWLNQNAVPAEIVAGAVLAAGTTAGVGLANRALTPKALYAPGRLHLEGSTAFSSIATKAGRQPDRLRYPRRVPRHGGPVRSPPPCSSWRM